MEDPPASEIPKNLGYGMLLCEQPPHQIPFQWQFLLLLSGLIPRSSTPSIRAYGTPVLNTLHCLQSRPDFESGDVRGPEREDFSDETAQCG